MSGLAGAEVTKLLQKARDGDRKALDELLPLVYQELRRLAQNELRRDRSGHTLQPTALINEAFLRLFGAAPPSFKDRAHFFGVMARVMRQVLVDYARARRAQKRGGGLRIPFDEAAVASPAGRGDLLVVHEGLLQLERENPRLVTLIEMRFFAGMTAEDTAEALGESVHAIRHEIRYALARLRQTMAAPAGSS
jgi:RNA polymerase sigma-70 factor, ECF subfamily